MDEKLMAILNAMGDEAKEALIGKAAAAQDATELKALAAEAGTELDEEQAQAFFDMLNADVELSEDETDAVGGGVCWNDCLIVHDDCPDYECTNSPCFVA